jgi:hypothetical protein
MILQPCAPLFEFPLREPEERPHGKLFSSARERPPQRSGQASGSDDPRSRRSRRLPDSGHDGWKAHREHSLQAHSEHHRFTVPQLRPDPALCGCAGRLRQLRNRDASAQLWCAYGGSGKGEDKPEVGARVNWTRTGIDLATETPTPEQIRDAVDQILAKPQYRACAQELAREFASYDSAKRLTEMVETLVAEQEVLIR